MFFKKALSAVSSSKVFEKETEQTDSGLKHSKRSCEFVEQLRLSIQPHFAESGLHVLAKTKQAEFVRRSEFLFDLIVVNTIATNSPFTGREAIVITESLLQIESEFALDFNQVMIDFSKLLCGLAPVKVMIMPFFKNEQTLNHWLGKNIFTQERRLADKAVYYLAYINHPKHWIQSNPIRFELYKCIDQEIVKIEPDS